MGLDDTLASQSRNAATAASQPSPLHQVVAHTSDHVAACRRPEDPHPHRRSESAATAHAIQPP